jgi:hypothetical protein
MMATHAGWAAVLVAGLGGCAATATDGHAGGVRNASRARADCRAADEVRAEPPIHPRSLNPRRVEDDYRVVASREVRPCVFAGTLAIETPLYADERVSSPFARAEFLQVEAFGLAAEGARQKLQITWPIRAQVWVGQDAFPFALVQGMDLVGDRYGLVQGARVAAWESTKPGTALVTRPIDTRLRVTELPANGLRVERACSLLTLPVEGLFDRALGPNHAMAPAGFEHWMDIAAGTKLHAAPGAPAHGTLPAMWGLAVLEERDSWVLVRNYSGTPARGGVDFKGWVRRADASPGLKPASAFGPFWLPATHRSIVEIRLRTAPEDSAPVVGVIPPGVSFRAVEHTRDHVEVHLPGLTRGGTWIAEAELCTAARQP